jgi:hypothetical protein
MDILDGVLRGDAEFLPAALASGEPVWILHVTTVIDAIDPDRIRADYNDDGTILSVDEMAFLPSRVAGVRAFKYARRWGRPSKMYFSEEVVSAWRQSGLTGLGFDLAWSGG